MSSLISAPYDNAISDFLLLITKALPTDEERLARFKLRSPMIYARIKNHLVDQICFRAKKKGLIGEALIDFIMLETDDLADSEQKSFLVIVPQVLEHLK